MNLKKIKDDFKDEHFAAPAEQFSLVDALNSLLAEEIQAAYDYFKVYPFLVGVNRPEASEEFLKHAEEECEHAKKLINRLNELGFECRVPTIGNVSDWATMSSTPWSTSLEDQCVANRDAEQAAINHYNEVLNQIGDSDLVTRDILKEILADEEEHYTDLQEFIDDINSTHTE